MVEGTIIVSDASTRCLFNSGLMHLFVSLHFTPKLEVAPAFLDDGLTMATLIGVSLDIDVIYRDCIVGIKGRRLPVDLVLLNMRDFDIILGMN